MTAGWKLVCTLLAVLGVAFGPSQARAAWLRAESSNFILYSNADEATTRAQVAELEDFDRLLRVLTGTSAAPPTNKLTIYAVRRRSELQRALDAPENIAGVYIATPTGLTAFSTYERPTRELSGNWVLLHEYAHHFMLQHFPAHYPSWFVEGFAEFVATARFEPTAIEYGRPYRDRARWLAARADWLPLEQLLFAPGGALSRFDEAMFYAQSWILVHYLFREPERRAALNRYLVAINGGEDARSAFAAAFGTSVQEMQAAVRSYGLGRNLAFTRMTRAGIASAPVTLAPMPESADDLLLPQAVLRLEFSAPLSRRILGRIRRRAADHGDPYTQRVLAHAEVMHGDGAAGEAILDRLLAQAPNDAELLFLRGMRHLRAGRADREARRAQFRRAQTWFARAHRANPNHYPTLYFYAESLSLEPGFVSENSANILLLAHQLAPQVRQITLAAAHMLLLRGRYGDAEGLLTPLASSAHGGATKVRAQTLLENARARTAPAQEIFPQDAQASPAG